MNGLTNDREQEQRLTPNSSSSVGASVAADNRRIMMQIASEMVDVDTRVLIDQQAESRTRVGSSAGSRSNSRSQSPFSGKRKYYGVFKLNDAAARVKTAQEMFRQEDDQDMQAHDGPSRNRQAAPSKPGSGHDDVMTRKSARPGLKRINGDASLEYGGVPIAWENTEDEYTTDSDDSDNGLTLKNMTPEQAIRALRQGKHVRGPHGRLNSTTTIREMEMVIQERRRNHH